ncbi:unnamed protein product [Callosobruchus maculatus]|nr:unnamed protein product [Callosobruchus maculatus]
MKLKKPKPLPRVEKTMGPRKNKLNIQMLSKAIYDQVFIEGYKDTCKPELLEQCVRELAKHGMQNNEDSCYTGDVEYNIPPIEGKNIEEHFRIIGERQLKPYRDLVVDLLKPLPDPPKKWIKQAGWTRYCDGCIPKKVPYPLEEALVFDVEVCISAGKIPTLATAVSTKAWYGWVSPSLIEGTSKPVTSNEYPISSLIPLESTDADDGLNLTEHQRKPKIVVGHNVSFDRARIKEQYWLSRTATRFVDTMSLHISVGGLTSYQRSVLKSEKFNEDDETWKKFSSLNNLADCYKLYCNKVLDKATRDLFVTGSLSEISLEFQNVMKYCCADVMATCDILKKLFPIFSERFPHPVTLAGMLELGTAYLPVNSNWSRYIADSEQAYEDLDIEGRILLARRADQACQMLHDEKYKEDLWMWDQDWEVKHIKLKKRVGNKKKELPPVKSIQCIDKNTVDQSTKQINDDEDEEIDELEEKFGYLWSTKENLPAVKTLLPGYPNWYRKLCTKPESSSQWIPGPHLISTSMQITPKLLSLTWEGYPLHYIRDLGWGFLVPFSDDLEVERKLPLAKLLEKCPLRTNKDGSNTWEAMQHISKSVQQDLSKKQYYMRMKDDKTNGMYQGTGIWCNTTIEDCCWFFKLPHKDGPSRNVGNPLAKDYLTKFSENVLAGDTESAEQVLAMARKLSYWRNNRDRIMDQMVVWLNKENLPKDMKDSTDNFGAIVPQVVVCGTLTRRAVEPTWMTASNAHPERIGSELRAMVQAPPGYSIVGADVDSQELWIASVIGDSHHGGMHGCTPLGWMTLSGNKSQGTDMHSVTAKAVGISRDHAKVINYARIYGAGQNFAERLLKQFNPTMSENDARSKARKMFDLTKGKNVYYLKRDYVHEFGDQPYNKWRALQLAKVHGKKVSEMFETSKWVGGTESAMFNRLEEIANSDSPTTPFLEGRLSRALEANSISDDRFLPTKVNWVVQSGAADFLHLMLVCMRWIMGDNIRFCLSFHDEVRYLVKEKYRYQAALALHTTNLLTRAFCAYRLGLNDLPQTVAFFSSVEVDKVLRKESKQDCITPSNPHGLKRGYGIDNGEAVDIHTAIEKAGGNSPRWYQFDDDR